MDPLGTINEPFRIVILRQSLPPPPFPIVDQLLRFPQTPSIYRKTIPPTPYRSPRLCRRSHPQPFRRGGRCVFPHNKHTKPRPKVNRQAAVLSRVSISGGVAEPSAKGAPIARPKVPLASHPCLRWGTRFAVAASKLPRTGDPGVAAFHDSVVLLPRPVVRNHLGPMFRRFCHPGGRERRTPQRALHQASLRALQQRRQTRPKGGKNAPYLGKNAPYEFRGTSHDPIIFRQRQPSFANVLSRRWHNDAQTNMEKRPMGVAAVHGRGARRCVHGMGTRVPHHIGRRRSAAEADHHLASLSPSAATAGSTPSSAPGRQL